MINRLMALLLSAALLGGVGLPWSAVAQEESSDASYMAPTLKTSVARNNSYFEIPLNKARILELNEPVTRVSISNPELVGVVLLSPTQIQLVGQQVGSANLLVWREAEGSGYLNVDISVHRDITTLAKKIKTIDPGIDIVPVAAEDAVILVGTAETADKAQVAYDLARAFFGGGEPNTSSNATGSGSLAGSSSSVINMIKVQGQPVTKAGIVQQQLSQIDDDIKLNVVPGFGSQEKVVLTGTVRFPTMVAKAVNLASVFYGQPGLQVLSGPGGNLIVEDDSNSAGGTFAAGGQGQVLASNTAVNVLNGSVITDGSGNVVSMLQVRERPQVRCSIQILEVAKTANFNTNSHLLLSTRDVTGSTFAGGNGQNAAASLFTQVTGTNVAEMAVSFGQDFNGYLSGLIQNGKARILAEPTITTESGEAASFLAGGEFPIPISNANGQVSILFREFGVRLNMVPTVTERGTIHMQVGPEVSTLDPASGITLNGITIPGLRTRRSQAVIEMHDGDNFVLSGMYNDDMSQAISKTPLLGQIPILGELFRSRTFQRSETELVIVIHPEIVHSADMKMPPQKTGMSEQKSEIKYMRRIGDAEDMLKQLKGANAALVKTAKVEEQKTTDKQITSSSAAVEEETFEALVAPPVKTKKQLRAEEKAQKKAARKLAKRQQKEKKRAAKVAKKGSSETSKTVSQRAAAVVGVPIVKTPEQKKADAELAALIKSLETK